MAKIRAVIFDLDGVLVDSEPLHYAVLNRVLAKEGYGLDQEHYNTFIGTSLRHTATSLVNMFGLSRSIEDYELVYKDELLLALQDPIEPNKGARQLLMRFMVRNLRLAVASSSPRVVVEAELNALGLAKCFEAVVAGDEVTRGKPDPEIFLRAAEKLSVDPEGCLVIEDAPVGVAGALAAGMRVAVLRSSLIVGRSFPATVLVVDGLDDPTLARLCLVTHVP